MKMLLFNYSLWSINIREERKLVTVANKYARGKYTPYSSLHVFNHPYNFYSTNLIDIFSLFSCAANFIDG